MSGNIIRDNAVDGIKMFRDSSATITNNHIENNGRRSVSLDEYSVAEVNGNTIIFTDSETRRTPGVHGITVFNASAATIMDNHINGIPDSCISVATFRNRVATTITHNTLTDCRIGVIVAKASTVEIIDNTIASQRTVGVEVSAASTVALSGNTLSDTPIALLLQGKTSSATLRGGTISGSSYAAVSLIGGTTLEMSLDSPETLSIADNSGVGLLVADDTSQLEFDSSRTQFAANGGGDIQGRGLVVDVAEADSDGDGLLDSYERRYGFDPLTPGDGATDSDGDGLSNSDEQDAGTDPRLADSDGDGLSDGAEVTVHHTDPLRADSDIDGLSDGAEVQVYHTDPSVADSDGDGLGDGEEILLAGLDPLNPGDAGGVVDLMTNGGFEIPGTICTPQELDSREDCVPGWTLVNQTYWPASCCAAAWLALQATTTVIRGNQVPPPPQGNIAAIAESEAADSTLTLRQVLDIPPATSVVLGVDVLVLSGRPFATPEGNDLTITGNDIDLIGHQFRIDLIDPETDDFAAGDVVLASLFHTEEGTAPILNYRRLLFDLTRFAGQRVMLRLAHQQNPPVLVTGVDNVRVLATGVAP